MTDVSAQVGRITGTVALRRLGATLLRQVVWEQSNGLCGICNLPVTVSEMEIDHVVSQAAGGSHDLSNLQASHPPCNAHKGTGLPRRSQYVRRVAETKRFESTPLLTVRQVAQRLQVAEITIRRWIATGHIKGAIRVTRRSGWRIRESEVERLLRESER